MDASNAPSVAKRFSKTYERGLSSLQDTDTMQLVSDDAVTEALESDNLALQNMSGSKYVQVNITQRCNSFAA